MTKQIEKEVFDILMNLGISPSNKGFHYLREAIIKYVFSKEGVIVQKDIYSVIGEENSCSACSVERAIRHSIKSGWSRHNERVAEMIFLNSLSVNDVPTNSVFITTVGEWIKLNNQI